MSLLCSSELLKHASEKVHEYLKEYDCDEMVDQYRIYLLYLEHYKQRYLLEKNEIRRIANYVSMLSNQERWLQNPRWESIPNSSNITQYQILKEMQLFYYEYVLKRKVAENHEFVNINQGGRSYKEIYLNSEKFKLIEINKEDIHYAEIIHTDSFYESLAASKNIKVPYFHGIFLHNECAICGEEFEEGSMVLELSCKHVFHFKCSHFWFKEKTSCAICRKQVAFAQKIYIKWRSVVDDEDHSGRKNLICTISSKAKFY
ncbi:hypothetical protein HELRODRAFT_169613 [Helobdella robusta]|uniref:RING-type domain-containing protein n=1 Tax=Helobdella robusta TaxID=6412 RepID=T1F261_HELRO|nr:hypothetical protein HELRODRAFT_169613 [Helobdella robusta]ESO07910.1 hypothetical protein HELRODRAFT_169613 [Helobdella robusta]